ncbi:hypothetical protein UFOVP972_205 [uncultured Caudovirales phage]|uniref:Uncharacterized protein n=1 Tax=uncultured Caudovirales phage TaxID=2100421 RepID=A0A6J5PU63_9CAUD|nr:hypothetical protein UFOVP972_205 [uncultured Caudovirales phage]
MSNILNFKNWVRLNESYSSNHKGFALNEALADNPDLATAAKTFVSKHKGNWNNLKGQTVAYAGSTYYICAKLSANPQGGTLMNEQAFSVYSLQSNKSGVPMPFYAGSVYISNTGKAIKPTDSGPVDLMNFYPKVSAGWKGITTDDISPLTDAGLTGEVFTAWCTKLGSNIAIQDKFRSHVVRNLAAYKTQPSGFAGTLWLAIKPLTIVTTPTTATAPVAKKP